MIVDDDIDDRFFFQWAVKEIDEGWECREAVNGEDALEKLRTADQLPDFIFLDLNMQLMDGKEFMVELKKDERLKNIPVIIYSTSAYQKDMDAIKKLGAIYYLNKTSDIYSLSEKIIAALKIADQNKFNVDMLLTVIFSSLKRSRPDERPPNGKEKE